MFSESFLSPIGPISIIANDDAITHVKFESIENNPNKITHEAIHQLQHYFNKKLESFHLPIELHGTPFQISVYELLREIPYGTTLTYHALATRFGNKNAIRAVAAANARNPLPILIPCHRVIGVDGKLIGYLGGISAKKYLLLLENKYQLF